MGHNTTLFFAHSHSTQICCRGYTQDTDEVIKKWYAYKQKSRDLDESSPSSSSTTKYRLRNHYHSKCRIMQHTPRLVHKPLSDCIRMVHMPPPQLLNSGQLYFTFDSQYCAFSTQHVEDNA